MKELLVRVASVLGKRNTRNRKERFLQFFFDKFQTMGFPVEVVSDANGRSRHLVVGNPKKADIIFITGYDTSKSVLLPGYRYYPLDEKKNVRNDTIDMIIRIVLALVFIVVYMLVVRKLVIPKLVMTTVHILAILFVFLLLRGSASPSNFNRNTVSIVALYYLSEKIRPNNYAFIYADNTVASYFGYRYLYEKLALKGKKVVFLDCLLTDGALHLITPKKDETIDKLDSSLKKTKHEANIEKDVFNNSSFSCYDDPVLITGAQKEGEEYYVTGTRSGKDSSVNDVNKPEILVEELADFIKKG